MTTMRYMVHDVGAAVSFYVGGLGFEEVQRFGQAIAIVRRGDLDLWLAGSSSSAARPMPDGRTPEPGGWNRAVIEVDDLAAQVEALASEGVVFRNEIVDGPGGRQILAQDPSGNVVELFEPRP
ncbi:MAG: VOC family protein [Actinobacteria bacterium]|nr:VOC family protein [Actinomycetota bacterium]